VSTPVELPTIPAAPAPRLTRERHAELASRVKLLSWLSLGWMPIEGAVAIAAGIVASSIALIGFGLDSVLDGAGFACEDDCCAR